MSGKTVMTYWVWMSTDPSLAWSNVPLIMAGFHGVPTDPREEYSLRLAALSHVAQT